jgi:hypothetical protein
LRVRVLYEDPGTLSRFRVSHDIIVVSIGAEQGQTRRWGWIVLGDSRFGNFVKCDA